VRAAQESAQADLAQQANEWVSPLFPRGEDDIDVRSGELFYGSCADVIASVRCLSS
jgi:hypothetical protein